MHMANSCLASFRIENMLLAHFINCGKSKSSIERCRIAETHDLRTEFFARIVSVNKALYL